MSETVKKLEALRKKNKKFNQKSGLCVGLLVSRTAKERGLPIDWKSMLTPEGGQVAGLGKAAIQKILAEYGITRVLAEEGGRTSRGAIALMKAYVAELNAWHADGIVNLSEAETWWIERIHAHFSLKGPKFHFDLGRSLRANIEDLLQQAQEIQANARGTTHVGAILQHLVGAKIDLVVGKGKLRHHGFSVADQSTERKGDYQVESVVVHVTTHPSEALIRKCAENLQAGLRPVIMTLGDGVMMAAILLKNSPLADRIDVLDVCQFLAANVYERSLFKVADCKVTLSKLLERYNEIVASCETDPSLQIKLNETTLKKGKSANIGEGIVT